MQRFGLIVHGGAGSVTAQLRKDKELRKKILSRAVLQGFRTLRSGGSSTDAVEEAIKIMEDSKIFNAGSGSCLTLEGRVEPDAGIMKGDLSCGSVANASIVKNPISLARVVMEKTDHAFIAGREALAKLAGATNFKTFELAATEARLEQYSSNLSRMKVGKDASWLRNPKLIGRYGFSDTVGAVALDASGQLTAGVSTGGRFMKLPGRVGDSPLVGAGLYAYDKSGAASATGIGEDIIRVCLCKTVCDLMKNGFSPQRATDVGIEVISAARGRGTAGVIAVDPYGNVGISRNTSAMPTAQRFLGMKKTLVSIL